MRCHVSRTSFRSSSLIFDDTLVMAYISDHLCVKEIFDTVGNLMRLTKVGFVRFKCFSVLQLQVLRFFVLNSSHNCTVNITSVDSGLHLSRTV